MSEKAKIEIDDIAEGHIVVGHCTVLKVLNDKGEEYWATRVDGVNNMEIYGMFMNGVDCARSDLQNFRVKRDD